MPDALSQSTTTQRGTLALTKKALSLFFRVGCERQFLLYLYNDQARESLGLPKRQSGRAGLGLVGRHGLEYQAERLRELQTAFGAANVLAGAGNAKLDLRQVLPTMQPYQIASEVSYTASTDAFKDAVGLRGLVDVNGMELTLGNLYPDLLQVFPPVAQHFRNNPDLPACYREEVLPDGTTKVTADDDTRIRLRVIDIKESSEPGAHYFAEVVFYSMSLAAWLQEEGLAGTYAVAAAPAVAPGSVHGTKLLKQMTEWRRDAHVPSLVELSQAFDEDLEIAPVEAFAPRIQDVVRNILPRLLSSPWTAADYFVDSRCRGCEFLGDPHILGHDRQPTQHELHCWSQAERDQHLSRVFGLSRGSSGALRTHNVLDVPTLADIPPLQADQYEAFQQHHGLRARRTIYPARAAALRAGMSEMIPASGGDALMPRWPDLHLYLFVDYDPATAMTITFAVRGFWREPLPFGSQETPKTKRWAARTNEDEVFLVDRPDTDSEWREFRNCLRHLKKILDEVRGFDAADTAAGRRDNKTDRSRYQIYLWDEAQNKHLVRLISRYLPLILADNDLRHLAWLFPPPELLAIPEQSTRCTPFTLVYDVVQNTVALSTPHHYTMLQAAEVFNVAGYAPSIHPQYRETLSNLLPPERIHEYWGRAVTHWVDVGNIIVETAGKKLHALGLVVQSLETHLGPTLSRASAPPIPARTNRVPGLAAESHLWLEFTRLNAALQSLDVHRTRAMPEHERIARFRSARLNRILTGDERNAALGLLSVVAGRQLQPQSNYMVYVLDADSTELNARAGESGFALVPEGETNFLDKHPFIYTRNTTIQVWNAPTVEAANLTSVSVEAIDRTNRLIALRPGGRNHIPALARTGLNFDTNVMLDPIHQDYLTRKVEKTLRGIGNPPIALPSDRVLEALGLPANTAAGNDRIRPAAEVLWRADVLAGETTGRDAGATRTVLEQHLASRGVVLLDDQWVAWANALQKRLALIWGPPGTGKSHTLRATILGAVLEALLHGSPLRILVTANTYPAVDNLITKLDAELRDLVTSCCPARINDYKLYRVQSTKRPIEQDFANRYPGINNIELDPRNPDADARALVQKLRNRNGVVIVGAPTQQVYNLCITGIQNPLPASTQRDWFDVIVMDEASQVDVASSALVFSSRARNGAVILAGDDLQLPPIHAAEAPEGLEHSVGSIYSFVRGRHGIAPTPLNVSFRSNKELIAFTREAGYDAQLRAHSPDLRLNIDDLSALPPADWPNDLPWSEDLRQVLTPDHPAVAVVYDDRQSAQSNVFEADTIAALALLLRQNMRLGLLNELDPESRQLTTFDRYTAPRLHTGTEFWTTGIGVVVPHRAQMSLVVSRLHALFPNDNPIEIRNAVDTVERFQGQQRDVILASFGLGDPDIIEAEDEFIYDLRRFNVLTSRARAKLIVFATRSLIEHLSNDRDVLQESLLLKRYAEQYCRSAGGIILGSPAVPCLLRRR